MLFKVGIRVTYSGSAFGAQGCGVVHQGQMAEGGTHARIFGPSYIDANRAELTNYLRGWAAPGTLELAGAAPASSVLFMVRRNKPGGTIDTCRVSGGPRPCDWGGKGFFAASFDELPSGQWPEGSRGELGRQEFEPKSHPRVFMSMNLISVPDAYYAMDHQTPAPSGTFLMSFFNFDWNPPCNLNVSFTYKISVPWDQYRKERKYFGLYDSGTFITTPGLSPTNCNIQFK